MRIRTAWDDKAEKWYFSIVDVVAVLTGSQDYQQARNYWKVLKNRLRQEGNESVTKCNQLKLASPEDGKRYLTDVADQEQLFRLIQSIPSKKAEPIKLWIAKVASERVDETVQLKFVASDDRRASVKQCRYAVSLHHKCSRRRGFPGHFPTGPSLARKDCLREHYDCSRAIPVRQRPIKKLQIHNMVKKKKNFF